MLSREDPSMIKYIKSELGGLRHFVRSHPEHFNIIAAPEEKEFTVSLVVKPRNNRAERSSSYSASTDTEEDFIDYASESESLALSSNHTRAKRANSLPARNEASPIPQLSRFSSVGEQGTTVTEMTVDPYITEELCCTVTSFIQANGRPDVPSRILGRLLAVKGCAGCPSFLAYIKGAYGSLGGFITAHSDAFAMIRYDSKKEFGIALVSPDEQNNYDLPVLPDGDDNDDIVQAALVRLVKDHVRSCGTASGVSSRDLGRFLMGKAFRMDGTSALQVLKERHGSVAAFLRTEPDTFLIFKSPLNKTASEFTVKLLS